MSDWVYRIVLWPSRLRSCLCKKDARLARLPLSSSEPKAISHLEPPTTANHQPLPAHRRRTYPHESKLISILLQKTHSLLQTLLNTSTYSSTQPRTSCAGVWGRANDRRDTTNKNNQLAPQHTRLILQPDTINPNHELRSAWLQWACTAR